MDALRSPKGRRGRPGDKGPPPPRCAYVLSGGGVYGAEQVGMIRALVEGGYPPDFISAVSVGALNGACMALDPSMTGVERIRKVWERVDASWLFPGTSVQKAVAMVRKGDHICDNAGLRRLIEENVRVEVFEDLRIPLHITTAELVSGAHRVFSTGPLRQVLMATTALPGIFSPVEVDGVLMVDGGVVSNIPTAPAVAARPERLFVLDVSRPVANRRPHTPLGMMIHALNITRNMVAARDLEAARVLSGAVVLPRPEDEPSVAFDDTSRTAELEDAGYRRTRRFLEEEWPTLATAAG